MMLTSCYTWDRGGASEFPQLSVLKPSTLCPGDLLVFSHVSSAAPCQMIFTGQFIVPLVLLHKHH